MQFGCSARLDDSFKKEMEAALLDEQNGRTLAGPESVSELLWRGYKIKRKWEVMTEGEARSALGKKPRPTLNVPTVTVPYLEGARNVTVYLWRPAASRSAP